MSEDHAAGGIVLSYEGAELSMQRSARSRLNALIGERGLKWDLKNVRDGEM